MATGTSLSMSPAAVATGYMRSDLCVKSILPRYVSLASRWEILPISAASVQSSGHKTL